MNLGLSIIIILSFSTFAENC